MELFPRKIAKAVFIAASMLTDGQSTLDVFNQQSGSNDLMRQAHVFLYANGNDHPLTAVDLDKLLLRDLLFNQSPAKDVALASVSMRPIPFAPVLEKLSLSEGNYGAVILVGHDFGGVCISYAMELFPRKITKAVFIAASMLTDGQSTLDVFNQQSGSNDLMRQAQVFLYAKGNDHPPTAIDLDKVLLRDLLFNQSPAKDVALASVSMRRIPFAPVLEKLSLSEGNYGDVRKFYIETTEDDAIPNLMALVLGLHKLKVPAAQQNYSIDVHEPLVAFALSCGMYSSPAVRVYSVQHVREELQHAQRDFVRASVGVSRNLHIAD